MCSSRSPHPSPLHHHHCCPALWWEQSGAHNLTAAPLSKWHESRRIYRHVCLWNKGLHVQKCKRLLCTAATHHRESCSLKAVLNSGTLLRYLWLLRFAAFLKKNIKTDNEYTVVSMYRRERLLRQLCWGLGQLFKTVLPKRRTGHIHFNFAQKSTFASPSQILAPAMPVHVLLIMEIVWGFKFKFHFWIYLKKDLSCEQLSWLRQADLQFSAESSRKAFLKIMVLYFLGSLGAMLLWNHMKLKMTPIVFGKVSS